MTSDLDEAIRLLRELYRFAASSSMSFQIRPALDAAESLLARHPEPPKLGGCPWCGGEPELATPRPNSCMRRFYCHNCQVYGPWGMDETDAAAAWNRRTP